MRLAVLSDVHGNTRALDAVLADMRAFGGVDGYWVLGDLAALGPDPVGALERLTRLPNVRFVRGNTDRYLATGARPPPSPDEARADPALVAIYGEVASSMSWSQGMLVAGGWLEWLDQLPDEQRLTLPDGTRVLGVHAAPGRDDGPGVGSPDQSDDDLRALFAGCEADLVFAGHSHWPADRTIGALRVVNLGSLSNPWPPDLRAKYTLLEADARGYRLEHRRVEYDRDAVLADMRRVRHPAPGYIERHLRGEGRPPWG